MTYIPPEALAAAREVVQAQDPKISAQHENTWAAAVWRAAIKQVTQEQSACPSHLSQQ